MPIGLGLIIVMDVGVPIGLGVVIVTDAGMGDRFVVDACDGCGVGRQA